MPLLSPEEECRSWVTKAVERIAKFRVSRHHIDALTTFAMNGPHSPLTCECKQEGILRIPVGEAGYVYKWQHEHLREFNTWWLLELRAIDAISYMKTQLELDILKTRDDPEADHAVETRYAKDVVQHLFGAPPSPKWILPGWL